MTLQESNAQHHWGNYTTTEIKKRGLTRQNNYVIISHINRKENMNDNKTITINQAVERMITAVNIVTGDDGHRSQEAVKTFLELLKMNDRDYNKQQRYYG
jgi:hypothetical protein